MLFLAQAAPGGGIIDMATLRTALGTVLGLVMYFAFIYGVVLIVTAVVGDRASGEWKFTLAKGAGLMAASAVMNILMGIFFPGQSIPVSFL